MTRLTAKLKKTHSWVLLGIEMVMVGCYYVAIPNSMTGETPFHIHTDFMDDWYSAIIWIVVGMLVIVNNTFDVMPDLNWLYADIMLFMWGFYGFMMLMRDLNDPHRPFIGITTLFFIVIMVRIYMLIWLNEAHPHSNINWKGLWRWITG